MKRGDYIGSAAIAGRLALAMAAFACLALSAAEGTALEGAVGAKADKLFSERLLCPKARGDIFEETVNAFATRMDDLHPYPQGVTNHYGWWQGEYWGKMMLSHCGYARYSGDASERDFVHEKARELVRRFQRPDGYLSTYDDEDHVFGFNWNVWSRKYTMWALVEAYDLTGDASLLEAAARMADHLAAQMKRLGVTLSQTGYFAGLPSMSILKPVVMLAERTGERRFMDLARGIVQDNDRSDGRMPNLIANAFSGKPVHEWYPSPESWAKSYEMMSVLEGFVEFSRATGERRPAEAAERIWELLDKYERNAVCGVGYHDHFLGAALYPNAITESCDVVYWMRLCKALYETTGRMRYLDAWEAAFLNAFLAGVYRDGSWGTHDVRSHGRRHLQGLYEVNMLYHACCIDNDPRGFLNWAEGQFAADGDCIDVNFYTDAVFRRGDTAIKVEGNYPVGDEVRVTVDAKRLAKVRFRVPAWSEGKMSVYGRSASSAAGRLELQMTARTQSFSVKFDMSPRIERLALLPGAKPEMEEKVVAQFEMPGYNREMVGLARRAPGVRVLRGPLVLAKARLTGCDDRTCFSDIAGLDAGWSASLCHVHGAKTWGSWELTLEGKGSKHVIGVCDYMSAADFDDPRNSFSIWF